MPKEPFVLFNQIWYWHSYHKFYA